jgi:tRNA-modifying protein YgfZ
MKGAGVNPLRLTIPDAVPPSAEVFDQGVAWHYGDPLREQRWILDGTAAVDISNRGVVSVTGTDRLTWLHDLTSQHVSGMQPGESALALILDPNGHVEFELHCVDDGETTWIITQPGQAEGLIAYLDRMRFMLRVEVADRSTDFAPIFVSGDLQPGDLAWAVPQDFAERGIRGHEVIVTAEAAEERLTSAEHRAGSWALEAIRIAALMPRVGRDNDHKTIPNEMGWLNNAVHLQKGCYRGQETVAKVNNLGRPPRKCVLLHGDDESSHVMQHCAILTLDGRTVGWIGTAAIHYELGLIALAIVKRNVPGGAQLTVTLGDAPEDSGNENSGVAMVDETLVSVPNVS